MTSIASSVSRSSGQSQGMCVDCGVRKEERLARLDISSLPTLPALCLVPLAERRDGGGLMDGSAQKTS